MASYKVCVFIALACAFAACSAENKKRFAPFGFGLAAPLPVATYASSYALPVAKTIVSAPVAPALTTFAAAPAISSYHAPIAAPVVSSFAAAPAVTSFAAPAITSFAAAPAITSYHAPIAAPVVSGFGYTNYAAGLGYSSLLK